ncbi:MAG: MBL fold metallo-hydrolase [Firmicutes bacterium]|nr:MBL fold metallo-hydrolase [Bacillota bacterium]
MSNYELHVIDLISTSTNCYLLLDAQSRAAAVIDPGCAPEKILAAIEEAKADVKMIINTHGHWDHIGANKAIQAATGAPIYISRIDEPLLQDGEQSLCKLFRGDGDGGKADRLLEDGDIIELGSLRLQVILTPGHTKGGICLLCEDLLFVGDTLFRRSIGRTDLIGGDRAEILDSLETKLRPLPDELKVLPGHGSATVLGEEKEYNPFFQHK